MWASGWAAVGSRGSSRWVGWGVALFCLAGCGRSQQDTASVCVAYDDDGYWALLAQARAGCHTEDLTVVCEAEVDGDEIVVSTETTWRRTEPLALACESALYLADTECSLPDLPDGDYVVHYAGQKLSLSLPAPDEGCIQP